jgi:multisubunit Na+/H+ antiporter MnhB subunit
MIHFKDSTALILISIMFFILTILACLGSAPILGCLALCISGLTIMAFGFYNLSNDN